MRALRPLMTVLVFLAVWWAVVRFGSVPVFMLPDPFSVAGALWAQRDLLFWNTLTTLTEILLGLFFGTLLGALAALGIVFSAVLQRWLMPVLVLSQAIPVFALAPLLVLWFGFGTESKVLMAVLVIFFPVTANFADGLRRTEPGWLDLARTMNASPFAMMRHVRVPAALPAFASGLRVATAVAPIGAIIGEWVGASSGLGFVALAVLSALAIGLYVLVDWALRRALYWVTDSTGG